MLPYADITETADRRWTSRLLDRLAAPGLPDEELESLVGALQAVSDPRSVDGLETVLCDTGRPARIREAVSTVLRGMHYLVPDMPDAKLRRWWREGDALLRRHALLCMDGVDCPDIVLRVATDPGHEFHAEALGRMEFFFDRPAYEEIKIAALAYPDPRVRETAATILLWDEPIRAEGPLIQATRDPVPEVAAAGWPTWKATRGCGRCPWGRRSPTPAWPTWLVWPIWKIWTSPPPSSGTGGWSASEG